MTPKYQILPAKRRLELALQVNDLLPSDKTKLIELIRLEMAGQLEGIFPGVSSAVYHHPLCPGFSYSSIEKAVKSATHWLLSETFETPQMKLGSAFHCLELEPQEFSTVFPKGALTGEQIATIIDMQGSFKEHSCYQKIFDPSLERLIEITIFAKCPITGLLRKVRPDILVLKRALVDLKTTGAETDSAFETKADSYHYEGQTAYYKDTCELAGIVVPENYQCAISRIKPHPVMVFSYDEGFLEKGRDRYWQGLFNIADLIFSNKDNNTDVIKMSRRGIRSV